MVYPLKLVISSAATQQLCQMRMWRCLRHCFNSWQGKDQQMPSDVADSGALKISDVPLINQLIKLFNAIHISGFTFKHGTRGCHSQCGSWNAITTTLVPWIRAIDLQAVAWWDRPLASSGVIIFCGRFWGVHMPKFKSPNFELNHFLRFQVVCWAWKAPQLWWTQPAVQNKPQACCSWTCWLIGIPCYRNKLGRQNPTRIRLANKRDITTLANCISNSLS